MTEQERNKQVARDYVDAFNRGDFAALRTIFAPDAVIQGVLGKGVVDAVEPIWRQLHEGLAPS
jgi:ketosteroid isomerase-like protein